MDAKTLGFGAAVIAASVGGAALITDKPTTELTVVAGGTATDEAVTEIAKTGKEVGERSCSLQREGTVRGIELAWFCDGHRMPASVQAELSKMAGADGVSIVLKPRLDGEKVIYDATVTRGTKPSLDPVPEPPKEEPKEEPVEP